jgi:hypothetical protein
VKCQSFGIQRIIFIYHNGAFIIALIWYGADAHIVVDVVVDKAKTSPEMTCVRPCPVSQDRAMSQHHDVTPFYNKSTKSESADPNDGAIYTGERKPA